MMRSFRWNLFEAVLFGFASLGAVRAYEMIRDRNIPEIAPHLEQVCLDSWSSTDVTIPTCNAFLRDADTPSRKSRALVALGSAYGTKGDHARAIATYEEALRNDPENKLAFAFAAHEQIRVGACSQAVENLQRAIALDSQASWLKLLTFVRPHGLLGYHTHDLGEAYACLSDWPKAVASYGRAIEVRRQILAGENVFGYRDQLASSLERRAAAAEAMGDQTAAARDRAEAETLRTKPRP